LFVLLTAVLAAAPGPVSPARASAAAPSLAPGVVFVSADPFAPPVPGEHQSEVEPAVLAYGGTLVTAFQVGRLRGGGSVAIGWATYRAGAWQHGLLPALTTAQQPAGPFGLVSDASVAYDATHHTWLIGVLADVLRTKQHPGRSAVLVVRSPDGLHWGQGSEAVATVAESTRLAYDKPWVACDDGAASPYAGRCYATWDSAGRLDHLLMSTSGDGGDMWSAPAAPPGAPTGLAGIPLVRPDGTVVVPALGEERHHSAIVAVRSTDGGITWTPAMTVSVVQSRPPAGHLRGGPLPSSAVDGRGRLYVVWQDCRFEPHCAADDLVMATSPDGTAWSAPARLPLATESSGVDQVIPGLAAGPSPDTPARLALTYYTLPAACPAAFCALSVEAATSSDGGSTWSVPRRLAGPLPLSWLARTVGGYMVGDYIATTFLQGQAVGVFAVAQPPTAAELHEAIAAARLSA
jgi:hypothetical protein